MRRVCTDTGTIQELHDLPQEEKWITCHHGKTMQNQLIEDTPKPVDRGQVKNG